MWNSIIWIELEYFSTTWSNRIYSSALCPFLALLWPIAELGSVLIHQSIQTCSYLPRLTWGIVNPQAANLPWVTEYWDQDFRFFDNACEVCGIISVLRSEHAICYKHWSGICDVPVDGSDCFCETKAPSLKTTSYLDHTSLVLRRVVCRKVYTHVMLIT